MKSTLSSRLLKYWSKDDLLVLSGNKRSEENADTCILPTTTVAVRVTDLSTFGLSSLANKPGPMGISLFEFHQRLYNNGFCVRNLIELTPSGPKHSFYITDLAVSSQSKNRQKAYERVLWRAYEALEKIRSRPYIKTE